MNPKGMKASIQAAATPKPYLPPPTSIITIKRKGFERLSKEAIRTRHLTELLSEGETLQVGSVVFLCFTNPKTNRLHGVAQ